MKVSMTYALVLLSLLCFFCAGALAGPANPDAVIWLGDEGQRFAARIVGDEWVNYVEKDGYTILHNEKNGRWEYAVRSKRGALAPSGVVVLPDEDAPTAVEKHLRPERSYRQLRGDFFPTTVAQREDHGHGVQPQSRSISQKYDPELVTGARDLLFIRVAFADQDFDTTAQNWDDIIFDGTPGRKTVKNFYDDNSFGLIQTRGVNHSQANHPAGIVSVRLNNINHPNTGRSNMSASEKYQVETRWINAALTAASRYVDFNALDDNRDGRLTLDETVIYFIVAGYDAASTAKSPNVWGHKWSSWRRGDVMAGGVELPSWALNGELTNDDGIHPMGVIAHELGHLMCGLPDLYDINRGNAGMGIFSLMAGGSWGYEPGERGGSTPVSMDAWCRHFLQWSQARRPGDGERLTFEAALSDRQTPVLLQGSKGNDEFFLVENRAPIGWDRGMLPRLSQRINGNSQAWTGGLLIQHIDTTQGNGGNDLNSSANARQGVTVVEASNAAGSLLSQNYSMGHHTHLFYRGNNDQWNNSTNPGSRYYDGSASGFGLYNVSAPGEVMTADTSADGGGDGGDGDDGGDGGDGGDGSDGGDGGDGSGEIVAIDNNTNLGNLSAAAGQFVHYKLSVPAGAVNLRFQTSGGSGDADLYLQRNQLATTESFIAKSTDPATTEAITMANPAAGDYFLAVHAWSAYSGMRLTASYEIPERVLENGVAVVVSGAANQGQMFKVDVPQGARKLTLSLTGGSGDGELFVSYNNRPTKESRQWASEQPGNAEVMAFEPPSAGTYYVLVWGYSNFADARLQATYESGITYNDSGRLNGYGYTDYQITVNGGTIDLDVTGRGYGDADLYLWGPSGQIVAASLKSGSSEQISYATNGQTGTYWVRVYNDSRYSLTYNLSIRYQ